MENISKSGKRILNTVRYSFWSNRLVFKILTTLRKSGALDSTDPELDVVFVLPPKASRGWILDDICRRIGSSLSNLNIAYCSADESLPPSKRYFFSHYMYYFRHLSLRQLLLGRESYIFATHLESSKHAISDPIVARLLNYGDGVICMNGRLTQDLEKLGVHPGKLHVAIGGADPATYKAHIRSSEGKVGFCSAFYPRKSPELMFQLMKYMPWRNFILLGRGWEKYSKFEEMLCLKNFQYVEAIYKDYPKYYESMSVLVSPSRLEGGPIPLLEAMMSNVVPVASMTGFSPEIISHGKNGYTFQPTASVEEICALIDQAFKLPTNVSESVQAYSWIAFSNKVARVMNIT